MLCLEILLQRFMGYLVRKLKVHTRYLLTIKRKYHSHQLQLRSAGEFSNCFGSFRDGVFGEFTGKDKFDSRLDFAAREGPFSIVSNQFAGLPCDLLKGVINKGVHDVHRLLADPDFGVDLLQNLVDVEGEGLYSSLGPPDDGGSSSTHRFCSFSWGHCVLLFFKS